MSALLDASGRARGVLHRRLPGLVSRKLPSQYVKFQAMRVLIVVRLSRETSSSTSVARQTEVCEGFCRERGWEPVAVCEDVEVSGSKEIDPFNRKQRPNLARWLNNEVVDDAGHPIPFDAVVTYRADRLTRSVKQLQRLVHWAEENDKVIVSATEPHFDMASPFSAVLIALIGMISEFELAAISERNASTARRNMRLGMYRGSVPPWGYMPKQDKRSKEWRLVHDPTQVPVVHEVVERVLDGEPLNRIANDLTLRGVQTPKDRLAELRDRPVEKAKPWSSTQLKRSLLSEAMLGYVISDGKPMRNDDGSPIVRSDPILSRELFDRVRGELGGRKSTGEPTKRSTSLLVRVIKCGVCGGAVYKFNGGSHSQFPRYRCKSVSSAVRCGNRTVSLPETDGLVESVVLRLLGSSERMERRWDAGCDNSAQLEEVNAKLADLVGLLGEDVFRAGTPQRVQLDARIADLGVQQRQLEAEVNRPAGWGWEPTGELFADWWERQDVTARNLWLRSMNVRVTFDKSGVHLDLGDVESLLFGLRPDREAAGLRRLFEAMKTGGIAGIGVEEDKFTVHLPDGSVVVSYRLSSEHEAQAAEFYGWGSDD